MSTVNEEISRQVQTLEVFYFLLQSLESNGERLGMIQENFTATTRAERYALRDELRKEVQWLRGESGAIAEDSYYRDLVETIRNHQ
jgi:hypothetical protein